MTARPSTKVMKIGESPHLSSAIERIARIFKGIKVDLIAVSMGNEGRIDESPSVNDGVFDEVRINGRLDQYPLPWACVSLKGNVQTGHQPG